MDSSSGYHVASELLTSALLRTACIAQNELRCYGNAWKVHPEFDVPDVFTSRVCDIVGRLSAQTRLKKTPQRLDTLASSLLIRIAFWLPLRDRINLVYTCKHIRAVLCSKPHLWTSVSGDSSPRTWWLTRWILRCSAPLPARLQMEVLTSNIIDDLYLRAIISPYFARLSMLNLTVREATPSRGTSGFPSISTAWSLIRKELCAPSPHLASLELKMVRTPGSRDPGCPYLPTRLLASDSQAGLWRLKTSGLYLYPNGRYPAFSQLTTFHYAIPMATLHEWELESISRNIPQLRYLGLAAFEYAPNPAAISTTSAAFQLQTDQVTIFYISNGLEQLLAHFREVTVLELPTVSARLCVDALNAIGAPHVQLFIFSHLKPGLSGVTRRASREDAPSSSSSHGVHSFDSHQPADTPQGTYLIHHRIPEGLAYQRITHICTTEDAWISQFVRVFRGLDLPHLAELVITLASSRHTAGDLLLRSNYIQDTESTIKIIVPSLKRLYLVNAQWKPEHEESINVELPGFWLLLRHYEQFPDSQYHPSRHGRSLWSARSVSLFDVASFVSDLVAPAQRLDLVCLVGVTTIVDLDLEGAWKAVLDVAHRLDFGSPEHAKRARMSWRKDVLSDEFPGHQESMDDYSLTELRHIVG